MNVPARLDEANALVTQALKLNPACPMGLVAWAPKRLSVQAGQLDEAERQLACFSAFGGYREAQIRKCYELGSILDRQKRYDDAMLAFLEAKRLLQPDTGQYAHGLQVIHSRLEDMTANISSDMLERWFDSKARCPGHSHKLALLGGHPRSVNDFLLEQVLDSHPDIVSAEETEIFHDEAYVPLTAGFAEPRMLPVLEAAKPEALQRSRERYFRFMELCLGQPIAGRLLIDKNRFAHYPDPGPGSHFS